MANTPSAPAVNTPLYRLIAEKLGQDPLKLIRKRRAEDPPVPFAKIADELRTKTGEYLTHEAPRRWYHAAVEADAA